MAAEQDVESTVREIRRKTRKKYTAEEKIRIVLEGLRGEAGIAELCRREGIQYDAGMGILPIPADASKTLLYSDPYLQIGQSIIVRAVNMDITGVESLAGKHVDVQIGSQGAAEVAKNPDILVVPYDTVDQQFQSLEADNVQAVVTENTIAALYIAQSQGALKSVGGVLAGENIGIAICPTASGVCDRINQGLAYLHSEGKLDPIVTKWLSGNK